MGRPKFKSIGAPPVRGKTPVCHPEPGCPPSANGGEGSRCVLTRNSVGVRHKVSSATRNSSPSNAQGTAPFIEPGKPKSPKGCAARPWSSTFSGNQAAEKHAGEFCALTTLPSYRGAPVPSACVYPAETKGRSCLQTWSLVCITLSSRDCGRGPNRPIFGKGIAMQLP